MRISKAKEDMIDKLFSEALDSRESGNLKKAVDQLERCLSGDPKYDTAVLGVMGNIYWEFEDLEKSLDCYKRATKLSPKSEMASLGLFHTHWKRNETGLAFEEAERFLSTSASAEYSRLLDEMADSLTSG